MLRLLRQRRTLIDVDLEIRTMLAEEYGLSASPRSPRMAAALAYLVGFGLGPLFGTAVP
ncbi:hypothetical protein [Mycobacterium sp. KBS0706]|uniref:hypothetical protein n=1 Tax=Mycobacterium sp. KBS0706 TaxID=2578109 RepID=UPI00163DC211|nr:hypothetical protein [Mycobacterium sp. KBS0706]